MGNEERRRQRVASRCPDPKFHFSTLFERKIDEAMRLVCFAAPSKQSSRKTSAICLSCLRKTVKKNKGLQSCYISSYR